MSEYIGWLDEDWNTVLDQSQEIVRCKDCTYYDGEPDMESMGEKCWRDPNHSGRSMPTVADGFCAWAEPKERK